MEHIKAFQVMVDWCASQDCATCYYCIHNPDGSVNNCGFNIGVPPRYWPTMVEQIAHLTVIDSEFVEVDKEEEI